MGYNKASKRILFTETIEQKIAIRNAIKELANTAQWDAIGVTLNHRMFHVFPGAGRVDPIDCSTNLRHFLNRLNRSIYGNQARKGLRKLRVLPVLERDKSGRYHYHLHLEQPSDKSGVDLSYHIMSLWPKTRLALDGFGRRDRNDINLEVDQGWVAYMTKLRSKEEYGLAFDYLNFHNG